MSNPKGGTNAKITLTVITAVLVLSGIAVWYSVLGRAPSSYPEDMDGSPLSPDKTSQLSLPLNWTLLVDGTVEHPLNLTLEEIAAMPQTTVNSEIYCMPAPGSPGVLVDEGNWTGVRLKLILQNAGVSFQTAKVAFYAKDGFITDLDVATAMHDDVILAYLKDGKPSRDKLRLVVPGYYGYKWIKYLFHIELVDYDFKGTYESRGFPDNAGIGENE